MTSLFYVRIDIKNITTQPHLLADATLVFTSGELKGLELRGFTVWRGREGNPSVTPPSRPYKLGEETKYYWLLRSSDEEDDTPIHKFRQIIVNAYLKEKDKRKRE